MRTTADSSGLDRLLKSWDTLLKEFPEAKRKVLEEIGQRLLANVKENVGGEGKVAGWQSIHMGSGGGYVAIRPKAKTFHKGYAVGHITNAIEGGHKPASRQVMTSKGYRYRPRHNVAAIPGKWFYMETRENLALTSPYEIEELVQTIVSGLEGDA